MANKKITALTQASGALDRTTALMPYVQGGVTKKVSLEQVTGRYRVTGTIPSADILTAGSVPYAAIPTPGPGYYIRILNSDAQLRFNSAAYTIVQNLILKCATATKAQFSFAKILINTVSAICPGILQDVVIATDTLFMEDEAVFITTATGADPSTGDSDVDYVIDYEIRPVPLN